MCTVDRWNVPRAMSKRNTTVAGRECTVHRYGTVRDANCKSTRSGIRSEYAGPGTTNGRTDRRYLLWPGRRWLFYRHGLWLWWADAVSWPGLRYGYDWLCNEDPDGCPDRHADPDSYLYANGDTNICSGLGVLSVRRECLLR